jgi:dihydrofolate synthase/folylpolyglutamate synthase
VAVLEIGLGGRLDAVNIVDADVAVITAIDLDHQHWLGDTVEEIAPEKAAIARPGRPVILAERSYPSTLFEHPAEVGALPARGQSSGPGARRMASSDCAARRRDRAAHRAACPRVCAPATPPPRCRPRQLILGEAFDPQTSAEALRALSVPGRRQAVTVQGRQLLFDVAHNPAAMAALAGVPAGAADRRADNRRPGPDGGQGSRGHGGRCSPAALTAPGPGHSRYRSRREPERIWQALDEAGIACPQAEFTPAAVWAQLLSRTDAGDRIVVCGSFHSVAGIMQALDNQLASLPDCAGVRWITSSNNALSAR